MKNQRVKWSVAIILIMVVALTVYAETGYAGVAAAGVPSAQLLDPFASAQQEQQEQSQATPPSQEGSTQAVPSTEIVVGGQQSAALTIRIEIVVITPEPASTSITGTSSTGTSNTGASNAEDAQGQATPPPSSDPAATGEPNVESSSTTGNPQAAESDQQQEPASAQQMIDQGSDLYFAYCAACHQAGGQGVEGIYPPLAGNPFVTAEDPTQLLEVVLTGRGGMPHFQQYLSTEELAAIVSFVRNGWGNSASAISVEQVNEVGQQFGSSAEVIEH